MIDFLQTVAFRIRPLRLVAFVAGLFCLGVLGLIIFGAPASGRADRYLTPAIVGFIWCLSAYGFIDTFQSVPDRVETSSSFFDRLKRHAIRGWFWFLGLLFGISTLAALFLTVRLSSYWLGKYYG